MADHLEMPASGEPDDAALATLASRLHEIEAIIDRIDPSSRHLLESLLRKRREEEAKTGRKRRRFGAFKGKFDIGPEFFEPLPEEELRAWGEI